MECLLPYLCMVTVPHIMVGLERMLDYRGVGLAGFRCIQYVGAVVFTYLYIGTVRLCPCTRNLTSYTCDQHYCVHPYTYSTYMMHMCTWYTRIRKYQTYPWIDMSVHLPNTRVMIAMMRSEMTSNATRTPPGMRMVCNSTVCVDGNLKILLLLTILQSAIYTVTMRWLIVYVQYVYER